MPDPRGRRIFIRILLPLVGTMHLLSGCLAGVAFPDRRCSELLRTHGYDEASIEAVVQGVPVSATLFHELDTLDDDNVRFVLARHPSLPIDLMAKFARTDSDFVRSGLAANPALPEVLVHFLMQDKSHTVLTGLARNPGLDSAVLLRLQSERELTWDWFALNPACPPEIEAAIRASGDARAIATLERVRANPRNWPIDRPVTPDRNPKAQ